MPVLSRSGGSLRFYSLGYICLESSKNFIGITEAVTRRCSVEKVFLEISKNTFSYRTPLVAISGITHNLMIISIFICKKFPRSFAKFLRKHFLTEHLRWLLLDITHNLMISISICFCNQTWFQNSCHM